MTSPISSPLLTSYSSRTLSLKKTRLQLNEQLFKTLVSNSSDIIVIISPEGTFRYISENIKGILGFEPSELLGKNAFELIHHEDSLRVATELKKVIDKDETSVGIAHRFLNKDGGWTWLESKGVNHLEDSFIDGIVVNARDVTDRIKLQQKLDLELASKQKDITAAVIETQEKERSQLGLELHDNVNQVLTTIKLYNEMLLDGLGDQRDILTRSIKHLQDCINEIRSISKRLSAPTLGDITLDSSIRELIKSINLTNRINIEYTLTGLENCIIPQDLHLAIYRIIQEQLNNILKHAEATTANIHMHYGNGYLSLAISDNGKGFDAKKKRKGIGITNMYSRAEHMGGTMKIISAVAKGTSLQVRFPLKLG
jgi:PAS domain S-box-containing protein